jgi:small subunit ribosomal protein S15
LTKPPYYFPKDTPVTNAVTAQERSVEIQEHDAKVTAELQHRLQIANQTPLLRHHMTGVQMSDRVRKLFDLHNGNQQEVVQAQKQKGMELFQLRPGDTGSSAVQVIALTTRIQQMQTHMATHKKDKHSKKGMDALYIRRRKMLDYMERKDFDAYRRVVKTLGLSRS